MDDLLLLIKDKQHQLAEAESLVAQLRSELSQAKELLLVGAGGSLVGGVPPKAPQASTDLAADVLRRVRQPMHVNHIISAIEREHHVSVKYATLVSNLSRLVTADKTFTREGPNIFGLKDWREEQADQEEARRMFGA